LAREIFARRFFVLFFPYLSNLASAPAPALTTQGTFFVESFEKRFLQKTKNDETFAIFGELG
jgi:hypothetical protein